MIEKELLATLVRAIERIVIVIFGGVSIWMGWNLFKTNILQKGSGKTTIGNWQIELKEVGPGVFFALFGAIILIVSLQASLVLDSKENPAQHAPNDKKDKSRLRYLSNQEKNEARIFSLAVNELIEQSEEYCRKENKAVCKLNYAAGIIKNYRDKNVIPSAFSITVREAASKSIKPEDADKEIQNDLSEYYDWLKNRIGG